MSGGWSSGSWSYCRQGTRQHAKSRPDFEHEITGTRSGQPSEFVRQIRVDQKILSEIPRESQPVLVQ